MLLVKSWYEVVRRARFKIFALSTLFALAAAHAESEVRPQTELWLEEPMPSAFRVESTELEGPVYADANGRTLYTWPLHVQRNGYSGESPGIPACYDEVLTVTAGLMSPYPSGIQLPDLDTRPSCTDLWPPVIADKADKPIGKWTIVMRRDGVRQWAYEEQPLYTSIHDDNPGDVLGGTQRRYGGDDPSKRVPLGPPSKVPPGFSVATITIGRILTTDQNESVYSYETDTAEQTMCIGECTQRWEPVIAPALARNSGEWSIVERSPGVLQWVFRGKPLYTHVLDQHSWSQQGSDVAGWSNVFTQRAPSPPADFTSQTTIGGEVLADANGKTVYIYRCGDDSADQLACDHPNDTQVYRLAMCGGGDAKLCLKYWSYVHADMPAANSGGTWSVMSIDPKTGHLASSEEIDAINVWGYRDRPVYTFGGDLKPGDVNGDGTGEHRGQRNGLQAFMLRDDFMGGTL